MRARGAAVRLAAPYLFIAPALLGLALFKLYPIGVGLAASFFDYEAISGRRSWIGPWPAIDSRLRSSQRSRDVNASASKRSASSSSTCTSETR